MENVGLAILRGADGYLRDRDSQPDFSGPRHDVRHHDLVAAKMVAPSMGHDLHHRLHVYGTSAWPADPCVGLPQGRGLEESSDHYVVTVHACFARYRRIIENCRRADFCT